MLAILQVATTVVLLQSPALVLVMLAVVGRALLALVVVDMEVMVVSVV